MNQREQAIERVLCSRFPWFRKDRVIRPPKPRKQTGQAFMLHIDYSDYAIRPEEAVCGDWGPFCLMNYITHQHQFVKSMGQLNYGAWVDEHRGV